MIWDVQIINNSKSCNLRMMQISQSRLQWCCKDKASVLLCYSSFCLSILARFCVLTTAVWTDFWQNLSWGTSELLLIHFSWNTKFLPHDLNKCGSGPDFLRLICLEFQFTVKLLVTAWSERLEFCESFLFLNTGSENFRKSTNKKREASNGHRTSSVMSYW